MTISVIIPAFNEERVLGRLLAALADPDVRPQLDVIVVCNGCTDQTAQVAQDHALQPRVITLPRGSKHEALVIGDRMAEAFPRFYVDADVEICARDVLRLAEVLTEPGVLAVAPEREVRLDQSSWFVRAYYRTWQQLPAVRMGLFGRGVLGVSSAGFERLLPRPEVLGDDLYVHSRFAPSERRVVPGTTSVVHGPVTSADLLRRRIRAAQGNRELHTVRAASGTGSASLRHVAATAARHPAQTIPAAVFLVFTVAARLGGRSQRASLTWLRDESSRT